jgi:hypothetical protein
LHDGQFELLEIDSARVVLVAHFDDLVNAPPVDVLHALLVKESLQFAAVDGAVAVLVKQAEELEDVVGCEQFLLGEGRSQELSVVQLPVFIHVNRVHQPLELLQVEPRTLVCQCSSEFLY